MSFRTVLLQCDGSAITWNIDAAGKCFAVCFVVVVVVFLNCIFEERCCLMVA